MKKIILLLLIALSLLSCEKDDICDALTVTTPLLKIDFYKVNTQTPRTVTNLLVTNTAAIVPIYNTFNNVATISVPLNNNTTSTVYKFTLNNGNSDPALIFNDTVTFTYTTNPIFVSRACGYKMTYLLTTTPITTNSWINNIVTVQPNIINNETHIKIYF